MLDIICGSEQHHNNTTVDAIHVNLPVAVAIAAAEGEREREWVRVRESWYRSLFLLSN